jgi:hypothetical protein
MRRFWSRNAGSPNPLRRRIEHASEELNPYLITLAIGLAIVNVVVVVVRVPHLPMVRCVADAPTALASPGAFPPGGTSQ